MADGSQHNDMDAPAGEGRWSAPGEVWAAVRLDYLAGLSAAEVCRRHGVGLSAMRLRAAREGWRRADQPWAPRVRLDPDDEGAELEARIHGNLDKIDPRELAWVAHRRMMRAVMRGEAIEALRWRRVQVIMDAEQDELDRFLEEEEAIDLTQAGPDSVDSVDGVFDPDDPFGDDFPAPGPHANLDP